MLVNADLPQHKRTQILIYTPNVAQPRQLWEKQEFVRYISFLLSALPINQFALRSLASFQSGDHFRSDSFFSPSRRSACDENWCACLGRKCQAGDQGGGPYKPNGKEEGTIEIWGELPFLD